MAKIDKMTFGEALRWFRRFGLREFAELAGIVPSNYAHGEKGDVAASVITRDELGRVVTLLKLSNAEYSALQRLWEES
jgi:hypothetical protein